MPWLMPSPAASAALRARRTPIRSPGWPTEPRFGPGWRPRWLARPNRRGGNQAVLFVDLDDFKDVDDALGHAAGDELLRVVAERLSSEVRIGDLVARLGGDEFALLLDGLFDPDRAYTVAERVVVTLAEPVQIRSAIAGLMWEPASGWPCARISPPSTRLCVRPTWRCTRPRGRARTASSATTPAWTVWSSPVICSRPTWEPLPTAASSSSTTSRWLTWRPARSSGWRRWCGGCTPPRAYCRRRHSSTSPRRRAPSSASAPGCWRRPLIRCIAGSAATACLACGFR